MAAAHARGKGVLFLTAHLGGWELSAFAHSLQGHPLHVVMRPLDNVYLDRLVRSLLEHVDLDRTLVCVASDHGNLEDLRTRSHTTNPVPVLLWGRGREAVASRLRDLTDIAPALLEWT